MELVGNTNSFSERVDLGILLRIPKGLQAIVPREGDLRLLSFGTMEERGAGPTEVEDEYLYPLLKSSR
jgi:hypothetical protein